MKRLALYSLLYLVNILFFILMWPAGALYMFVDYLDKTGVWLASYLRGEREVQVTVRVDNQSIAADLKNPNSELSIRIRKMIEDVVRR